MSLENKLKSVIRNVPDFPQKGILFKDITPILSNTSVMKDITNFLATTYRQESIDAIAGIESRGFIFGSLLAQALEIPFVPVRKEGKLPYTTIKHRYKLEYGEATLELHTDAFRKGANVLIHDDLLATGGTAEAAAELVNQLGGKIAGFNFLIELAFLNGRKSLAPFSEKISSIAKY